MKGGKEAGGSRPAGIPLLQHPSAPRLPGESPHLDQGGEETPLQQERCGMGTPASLSGCRDKAAHLLPFPGGKPAAAMPKHGEKQAKNASPPKCRLLSTVLQ